MSFETDLKRLETITEKLKDEKTGLEESLKLYEEASELAKKLSKTLEEVRRKVEAVKEDGSIENFEEK